MRFLLTQAAEDDLANIAESSRERWGREKTIEYMGALYERFEWLADHPRLGRLREEVGPDFRSFVQGSHIIFYRVRDPGVEIIGVPHVSMDLGAHFD